MNGLLYKSTLGKPVYFFKSSLNKQAHISWGESVLLFFCSFVVIVECMLMSGQQNTMCSKNLCWHRDHPFKTSSCLRGGGGSPLPMFAHARGAGVLGLPTSSIFESIRRQIRVQQHF